MLVDVLGESQDADADDDVIVPSRRWSCGLGEAGSIMPREYRLDFELEGTEYYDDGAIVDVGKSLCFWTQRSRTNLGDRQRGPAPQNKTLTHSCGRYACRLRSSQLAVHCKRLDLLLTPRSQCSSSPVPTPTLSSN